MEEDWNTESDIIPCVDETREFLEIANDFTNPLEVVREAISNSFDWEASKIKIIFSVEKEAGESLLKIVIEDDGKGMDRGGLQSFFDLGNSKSRNVSNKIGEKGHGTKVYFNSQRIEVSTSKNGLKWHAFMEKPFASLHAGVLPKVHLKNQNCDVNKTGTTITIWGYNSNRRERFKHSILKDYILWFTKYGGIDRQFVDSNVANVSLQLQGIDKNEPEWIQYGHVFPEEQKNVSKLFDEHKIDAPEYYVRKWTKAGHLRNFPEIEFQAVFYVEGDKAKRRYNPMLKRQGPGSLAGQYTVQDRYGLWLCKDNIPVQRKNEWITTKGYEYTRFHAFINCQSLRLTANRGSVENTPSEIMDDLRNAAELLYREITLSDDWSELDWLKQEATGYRGQERDEQELKKRVKICKL